MATRALDVVTILHALDTLDKELQTTGWNPKNPAQLDVFEWLGALRETLARITGLDAKASRFYEELNAFLAQRGFSPLIDPFDPKKGLGVVSILDKLVRWLHGPGTRSDISTRKGAMPGFELPPNGVHVYEVAGSSGSSLLELLTQSDDTLWLFMHDKTDLEGLDMVKLAMWGSVRIQDGVGYPAARIPGYSTYWQAGDVRWIQRESHRGWYNSRATCSV